MKTSETVKMNIYCVIGDTGEYSDHREWIVCWFAEKSEADEYARLAAARAKEIFESDDRWGKNSKNEYDPNMQLDYTGTRYGVAEVPKAVWKAVEGQAK